MSDGTHSWKQVCRCCGIERRVRHGRGGFQYQEYFVDGKWTTKRPDCRVVTADQTASEETPS